MLDEFADSNISTDDDRDDHDQLRIKRNLGLNHHKYGAGKDVTNGEKPNILRQFRLT